MIAEGGIQEPPSRRLPLLILERDEDLIMMMMMIMMMIMMMMIMMMIMMMMIMMKVRARMIVRGAVKRAPGVENDEEMWTLLKR